MQHCACWRECQLSLTILWFSETLVMFSAGFSHKKILLGLFIICLLQTLC